jgi:hypothetical protein
MGRIYLYRDDHKVLPAEFCVIGHAKRYCVLGTLHSRVCHKLFGTLTNTGCELLTINLFGALTSTECGLLTLN